MPLTTIVPVGTSLGFRLHTHEAEALLSRRLTPDEPTSQVINRQLRFLARAIGSRSAPKEPREVERGGEVSIKVMIEIGVAGNLVERWQSKVNPNTPQNALKHLLVWANDLPPRKSFLSALEVNEALLSKYKAGEMIPIKKALATVYDCCTISQAKEWLWALKQDGRLKLRIPAKSLTIGNTVTLPDCNGYQYAFVELW